VNPITIGAALAIALLKGVAAKAQRNSIAATNWACGYHKILRDQIAFWLPLAMTSYVAKAMPRAKTLIEIGINRSTHELTCKAAMCGRIDQSHNTTDDEHRGD
jgi:hypothetical protein